MVTSARSWNEPRPSSLPCSVSPTPAMTMPLPSIRRASARLGVASLIHPSSSSAVGPTEGPPRPDGRREGREATQGRRHASGWAGADRNLPVPCWSVIFFFFFFFFFKKKKKKKKSPARAWRWYHWYHLPVPPAPPRRAPRVPRTPTTTPRTDTYRQIYRGHDNASAVTNNEGLTVFFDPDTQDVLGFQIANFTAYYESHPRPRRASSRSHCRRRCRRPRGGDGLRRRGHPLRHPDRRVLLARPTPGARPTMIAPGPLPRGDHREHLGHLVDVHVNQRRPVGREASAIASSSSPGSWTVLAWMPYAPGDALEARLEAPKLEPA